MKRLGLGILGSGKGSNCRAVLESIRSGVLPADARVVISDVLDAPILEIAREFSVPNAYLPPGQFRTRLEPNAEAELVQMLRDAEVELVVLAGFMRVLKSAMLQAFPRRIINIHPSLLPSFPGLDAQRQALAHGVRISGATVHLVTGELDGGPIVSQAAVPVLDDDTVETLSARILVEEHRLYPLAIARVLDGNWTLEGRRFVSPLGTVGAERRR